MTTAKIELPPKLIHMFAKPRGTVRFRCSHGGRGSGKSFTFAKMAAVFGYAEPLRILCTRELQISIKESFYAELKNAIESEPWLAAHYDVGESFIRGVNGTEFIFRGLRHNITAIKSMAQIDLCIVEEAADVPQSSWDALLPTIRAPKSEIWCVWNPKNEKDPVDIMFRKETPPRSIVVEMNFSDNPWFPDELEEQRKHAQRVLDPATYDHIWNGAYLVNSDSQVFHGKWRVDDFEPAPTWDGPYDSMDFGFSQDPTAATRTYIHERKLYISHEAVKVGLELDETAAFIHARIPDFGSRAAVRADNARPESISYLKRHGIPNITGVEKWKGSVEDGIQFMRSFDEIIIHPRCTETINEFRLYSYKVDRLTGDITTDIVDANNHCIDSIRYGLAPIIRNTGYSWAGF